MQQRSFVLQFLLTFCNLLFVLILTACGTNNIATGSNLITYQGDGYSIEYPKNWNQEGDNKSDISFVSFSDVNDQQSREKRLNEWLAIRIQGSNDALVDDFTAANQELAFAYGNPTDCRDITVDKTVTINGIVWAQSVALCNRNAATAEMVPQQKIRVLVTKRPQIHKRFILAYAAAPSVFNRLEHEGFLPMVQSFVFR